MLTSVAIVGAAGQDVMMKATGQERPSVLRAARELGASSAAVYPYVAGRDELPTGLIVAAYDTQSSAAETREAAVDREDLAGRWAAACGAVRGGPWPIPTSTP
jgi:hypothetical protein